MTREEAKLVLRSWGVPKGREYEAIMTLNPELRESEDERVRKDLIDTIRRAACDGGVHISKELGQRYIAYLEKQKINTEGDFGRGYDCGYQAGYAVAMNEMKPKVATATLDSEKRIDAEVNRRVYDMIRETREKWESKVDDAIARMDSDKLGVALEEDKEPNIPKPHKGDDSNPYDMSVSEAQEYAIKRGFGVPFNDGEVYVDERHITQTIGNILRWADEHPKEQKPVEIKIDNPYIQKIDPNVKISISDSSADGEELLYVCNKSYKIGYRDGVNSVKPAEWSEEDKEMLEYIIGDVNDATQLYTTRAGKDMAEKEIAWLKSLRPVSKESLQSWKPSEEPEEPEYYQHFDPDC